MKTREEIILFVSKRKYILLKQNEKAMNVGDRFIYQRNCIELSGIDFVMNQVMQLKREPNV